MVDWKKEISFGGGKGKGPKPEAEPAAERTSIWKKEITFGRKPKEATAAEPTTPAEPVEAAPAEEREPSVPFWKKELTFGRKKRDDDDEVEGQPSELDLDAPAAVGLLDAYVAPSAGPTAAEVLGPLLGEPDYQPLEAVADVADVAEVADTVDVPEPEPAPVAEAAVSFPVAVPDPEPLVEEPVAEVVDLLAAAAPDAEEAAPPPPTIDLSFSTPPPPAPELAPVAEEPVAVPPAPAPDPAPVVVHPPVPAAQLPPLPDEDGGTKRRKKKEKKAKPDAGERVPLSKRSFSLGRKKERVAAAADDATPEREPERRARRSRSFSMPQFQARAAKPGKMPKRIVGLKVGASQLAAATVANNGHAEVLQVARASLDPGIVANGELRDPERLAEALKEFFKEHKLPRRGVRLGIATNRIGVRTLEISGIEDAKQLANAIRFRAQEALPIPIDEAVLDYQVLSETTNDEGENVRKILLVLAYRDLIDRYVNACRKAGIQLVGIDLEAFALLRALAAPREEADDAQAALVAVTVGHDRTTFAVSDGRVCEFTRVLDWGGHSLSVAVARAVDLAPSEVDGIKRQLALDTNDVPDGLRPEQAQKARDAVRLQVQSFARELVSSLQFYQNQPGSLGIGEIILTGGTAHLGGFADELQRLIGVRVRLGDPLVRVKVAKKVRDPEQLGSFAVAIGLGIED